MQFTQSPDYGTHVGTGNRLHVDAGPLDTVWSAQDANMVIWSLMRLIVAAGVTPATFDPDVPASYDKVRLAVRALSGVPVGATMVVAAETAPVGWLHMNGAEVNRADYPDLWAHAQANANLLVVEASWAANKGKFSSGNGATTFRVPDVRGRFFRAWDNGAGVDAGRAIGSLQAPMVQEHAHATSSGMNAPGPFGATDTGGRQGITQDGDNFWDRTNTGTDYDGTVNAAGVIGSETRPTNVAYMACIKT